MTVTDEAGSSVVRPEGAIVARFDPILRALLSFGLVERDLGSGDERDGPWRLVPAVQRRLEELFSPAPAAEKLIYFGHRCGSCGERTPTRFSGGAYLCDACRPAHPAPPVREGAWGA